MSLDRTVLEARRAFREGHPVYIAGFSHPHGARVSNREVRRALRELIVVVEAEGWRAVNQDVVGSAVEVEFHRA